MIPWLNEFFGIRYIGFRNSGISTLKFWRLRRSYAAAVFAWACVLSSAVIVHSILCVSRRVRMPFFSHSFQTSLVIRLRYIHLSLLLHTFDWFEFNQVGVCVILPSTSAEMHWSGNFLFSLYSRILFHCFIVILFIFLSTTWQIDSKTMHYIRQSVSSNVVHTSCQQTIATTT